MGAKHFSYLYLTISVASATLVSSGTAYASGGDGGHKSGGSAGGFPQLDTSTYPSQLFWLTISFIITYLILSRIALPKIAYVLDLRNTQREGNLAEAERLNEEAETALEEYKRVIAKAHDQVRVIIQEMKEDIAEMQNKHSVNFHEETQAKLVGAEQRLQKSVDEALVDVTSHAADLVQHASKRLGGISISKSDTTNIVAAVWKETGETA